MDASSSSGKPGSGGATGDLWKKVLEEVQSEAAARRSKVGARSATAPVRSNAELELLKRILVAIEAKPAGPAPVDHSELLHQILDSVKHPPQLDPSQITSPILAAIERADHDKRFKELEANLHAQLKAARDAQPKPVDHTEELAALRETVANQPKLDPQAILTPILDALAKQNPQPTLEHLRQELKQQIDQAITALPKPVDLTPQLTELRLAIEAMPKAQPIDVEALVARVGEAVSAGKPADIAPQLEALRQSIEAMPKAPPLDVEALLSRISEVVSTGKPADIAPQLEALRQSIEAMPQAQPLEVEALITRLREVVESSKPQDIGPALDALRQQIQSLPAPVDHGNRLDEILAATKQRPDDGRDEILLQILETVQQQASQPAGAGAGTGNGDELPRLLEQLEAKLAGAIEEKITAALAAVRQSAADPQATSQHLDELRRDLSAMLASHLAAQPQPVDSSAALQAILDAVKAQPRVDVDALIERVTAAVTNQQRESAPAFDSLVAQLSDLKTAQHQSADQLKNHVESLLQTQLEEHRAALAAQAPPPAAPPADPLPALQSALEQQAAQTKNEIQQLRDHLQQEITKQNGQVREDLLTHSIELIDQIKAQAPGKSEDSTRELLQTLRSEISHDVAVAIAALPQGASGQVEVPAALQAKLDTIERMIAQQQPAKTIDEAALAQRLRDAMPVPAPLDTAALAQEIRAALPAPAQVELPPLPSYAHDFAKQQEMLRELADLVKSQAAAGKDNSIAQSLQRDLEALMKQQRQSQQQMDRSIAALTDELETKLESKINSGMAKIELAMATADMGRPASITGDDGRNPAVSNYRYSWMNQPAPRNRTPAVALTVTAVAAVGMFLVLLISALTGGNNTSAPLPAPANGGALASNTNDNTPANDKNVEPRTAAPAPPSSTDSSAARKIDEDPVPTGPLFPKATGTGEPPLIAGPLVNELRNLTNPNSERTRVVYNIEQAKQVIFLVHFSGDSPTAMTTIVTQLKKAMAQLQPTQRFAIVFSEGNRFIEAPPSGLRPGTEAERNRVENWIDLNIRSTTHRPAASPLVAMDVAMSYEPDLLWIISDAFVSDEPGRVSSKEIIQRIATLNPEGSIRIAATQVGTPDANSTLRILAEKYGGAYVALSDGTSASIVP